MSARTKRVRRSQEQWKTLLAEQASGAVGITEFCEQRGLSPSSFHKWRRRLESVDSPRAHPGSGFVELMAPQVVGVEPAWDVELELGGGLVLRVRRG